jgi:predicted transcriptional regulator
MTNHEEGLGSKVRDKIYSIIIKNPGLHFREIQRRTETATGSLQYHLEVLQKRHLVKSSKSGKFLRYYSVRAQVSEEDKKGLELLRQDSVRNIVLYLMQKKKANNSAIAKKVGLSPSTTSFHTSKLVEAGIVGKKQKGRKIFFYIADPKESARLLTGYKKSFLDEMVDQFVETWVEI